MQTSDFPRGNNNTSTPSTDAVGEKKRKSTDGNNVIEIIHRLYLFILK